MPSTQEPTEQVRFLVSCIGHTNNGRPDFAAVAEELGIVSKAAAQKRYERMLKAHGVSTARSPAKEAEELPSPDTTPVKRKAAAPRAASGSAKKPRAGKAKVKKHESDDEPLDTKDDVKKAEDSDSGLSDVPLIDCSEI